MNGYDSSIVLGGGIGPGSLGRQRLEKGMELYKNSISNGLILTGTKEEIEDMNDYCLRSEIPENNIYSAEPSFETIGNLSTAKKIIEKNSWKKNNIVTNDWHNKRVQYLKSRILPDYDTDFTNVSDTRPRKQQIKSKIKEAFYYILDKISVCDAETEQIPRQIEKMKILRRFERYLPF